MIPYWTVGGRGKAVCIATGYGLDGWVVGVQVRAELIVFSSSRCPGLFWSLSGFYPKGNGGFPWEQSGWGVKVTTQLQLVPMWRKHWSTNVLPHVSMAWRLVKREDNSSFSGANSSVLLIEKIWVCWTDFKLRFSGVHFLIYLPSTPSCLTPWDFPTNLKKSKAIPVTGRGGL
jgi:hypothetical protein